MAMTAAGDDGGLYCHKWPAHALPGWGDRYVDEALLDRIRDLEKRLGAAEAALELRSNGDG